MILVDTSVWIDHLRRSDEQLQARLEEQLVVMHAAVLGEIALGSMAQRVARLGELRRLPILRPARDAEVLMLIERHALHGRGIGYVDAALVTAAVLTPGTRLWTRDRRLAAVAAELGVAP